MHICTPANTLKTALLRLIPMVAESLNCCQLSFNSAFGQGWITVQTLSQGLCRWLAEYGRPALFVLAAAVLDSDPLYDTVSESKFGSEHTNSYQFHFQNFPRVFREFPEICSVWEVRKFEVLMPYKVHQGRGSKGLGTGLGHEWSGWLVQW